MQVQSINNTYPQKNNIGFKKWERAVYNLDLINKSNSIKHRNTTWLIRPSAFYWKDLAMYIAQRFNNVPKVNTYVYGCSDGSDAYSFILAMESIFKSGMIQKFLPIIAKDYDSEAIEKGKARNLSMTNEEIDNIKELIGLRAEGLYKNSSLYRLKEFNKYFTLSSQDSARVVKKENGYECFTNAFVYRVNDSLFDNVIFQQADIKKDYINIEPNNSIVFARNFWPYLKENESLELARNLYNRLQNNSILILGNYDSIQNDSGQNASQILLNAGFKQSPIRHCFIKND